MEKDLRGVSPETQAAVIGGVAGGGLGGVFGVLGVLLGVFAERIAQRYGKLRYVPNPMTMWLQYEGAAKRGDLSLPFDPSALRPKSIIDTMPGAKFKPHVECRLTVELFNEKEVRTGLRDVSIVFEDQGEERMKVTPLSESNGWVDVVNIPSREWVSLDLRLAFFDEEAEALADCREVKFHGIFPDGRAFTKKIPIE